MAHSTPRPRPDPAARVPDERPEAWKHLPDYLNENAQLLGGILGAAEIGACRRYRNLDEFLKDQAQHLNEASWFDPMGLYGFTFTNPAVLTFRKYPGWMRFFKVEPGPFVRGKSR